MDIHPSCRRLHKIPAHTVKELWSRPQRLPPCAPTFPSLRAAHYSRLIRFVNTFFQGRFAVANRCCRCCFVVRPGGLFVEASRLLCQAFRFRQHLRSKKLKSCSFAVAALRWPLRRGRESMSPSSLFVKGVHDFFSRFCAFIHAGSAPEGAKPLWRLGGHQQDTGKVALADLQQPFKAGHEQLLRVLHHRAVDLHRTLLELA